jgi:hypothetical protein
MRKETDTHSFAHPYVRPKRPSLRTDLLSLTQGGGWRSRMAAGHREAARSVLEGHPPPCDASDKRALLTLPLPTIPTGGGKRNWEAHQSIKMVDCYSINYRAPSHFRVIGTVLQSARSMCASPTW